MFGKISLILGILLLVAVGANAFQYKMHENYVKITAEEIASLRAVNKVNTETIAALREKAETSQRQIIELSGENVKINEELNRQMQLLDTYKHRESTVLKKPGLVERAANSATSRVFSELRCVTGGDCPDKSVPSK